MELRTFIKQAISDIIGAVEDSQGAIRKGRVVPSGISRNYQSVKHGVGELQVIEFEVNVSAEESKGSEGKLGVISSVVGAGVAGKSSAENTHSSTLRFKIPIELPKQEPSAREPE
jgi:hypothetical protein